MKKFISCVIAIVLAFAAYGAAAPVSVMASSGNSYRHIIKDSGMQQTSVTGSDLTIHYVYKKSDSAYENAYYGDDVNNTTANITISAGSALDLVTTGYGEESHLVPTIYDKNVRSFSGDNLSYMTSRLGSERGPVVTSVTSDADGKLVYHTSMSGMADPDENVINPESWTLSEAVGAQEGRSLVVRMRKADQLILEDSINGEMPLESTGDGYKATFYGDNITVEYFVTPMIQNVTINGRNYSVTSYSISVYDSFPSSNTDIYQIYTKTVDDDNTLWIEDDIRYSGLFRVGMSDELLQKLARADEDKISFDWYEIVTADGEHIPTQVDDNTVAEEITRKQTSNHWNIAYRKNEATWLDIEAEEGNDVWTSGKKHSFYVKLTYTPKDATEPVILYSNPETVNYYGVLENGSFEIPQLARTSDNQFSNSEYLNAGGVWQTTGVGTGEKTGRDIEIVDATNHNSLRTSYHWQPNDKEISNTGSWAKDGNQFAELNAEAAGALYQDVITHPDTMLSYKLSHRARGSGDGQHKPEHADTDGYYYDSMYLVIMPTKLAMTSGSNQTELKSQEDLEKFIRAHGGFESGEADQEEDKITYFNTTNGILIRKISSDESDWHDIGAVNGYIAKGGLTRFFFVAGSTAADIARNQAMPSEDYRPTQGNFLDDVAFTQTLPTPEGFTLTVNKTFKGLSKDQVAAMASNNSKDPFTITIRNRYISRANTETTCESLDNARLQFTVSSSGDFKATAFDKYGNDLFKDEKSSGTVTVSDDGTVNISWIFFDMDLPTDARDQRFLYSVSESGFEVSGYKNEADRTYIITGPNRSGILNNGLTAYITQKDSIEYDIINSYTLSPADDPVTPVDPADPIDPQNPSTPDTPNDPQTPTEPVSPADPVIPIAPDTPTEPVNPDIPELPSTGGIGDMVFYIIGGILLIGAVVIILKRKRVDTLLKK